MSGLRAAAHSCYGPASSHRFFPALLTPLGRGADAVLVKVETAEAVLGDRSRRSRSDRDQIGRRNSTRRWPVCSAMIFVRLPSVLSSGR